MTNHTPGPWRNEGDGWVAVNDPDNRDQRGHGVPICVVRGAQSHQIDANAHLIASAPNLLAAGKAALKLLMRLRAREVVADAPEIRELSAAIAKAEGSP